MTIFNVGGGGSAGLTFKDMTTGPYEIKASDWADNQTEVASRQLFYNDNVTSAEIKSGYTRIGNYAFNYAVNLKTLILPPTLTTLGEYCLQYTGLENIDLSYVTSIETGALGYSKLTSVAIYNVTRINQLVFTRCGDLEDVTISANVTRMDGSSFSYIGTNTTGTTIRMLGSTPPQIFTNTFQYANITKIIVPQGSLTTYQTASNWTAYASLMEEAA